MFRDTEAFAMPAALPATPLPDPLLTNPARFGAWIEAFDRRMIARDSEWLALGDEYPGICEGMADCAARSIYRQPAIVWG